MTHRKPLEMGHLQGQGKPQRLGTPYSLSLSLSLLPYGYLYSPSITRVTSGRGAAAPIVTPSPLAHPDAMDGLTISLSDMPDIGGDGPPLCETALHCDSAIPADYLVQFTDPVLVDEWGDFVWPICAQCHRRGSRIEGDVEAWRIVRVLR